MSNDENTLVAGSSPAIRTIIPQGIEEAGASDTVRTQESAEFDSRKVRFPKRIKHRGRVLATIYGKSKSYPLYRVSWTASGMCGTFQNVLHNASCQFPTVTFRIPWPPVMLACSAICHAEYGNRR